MAAADKVHHYRCPGCAAELAFEPKDGCLVCPYCQRREEIPASADKVVERSYEEYLKARPEDLQRLSEKAQEIACPSCGAAVTFEPPDVATQCAFCSAPLVTQAKSADLLVAPQGLLPFAITLKSASEAVKKWLASRWFAPSALTRIAQQDSISGIYLPFWTFDSMTISHYTGERGDHYYETETFTTTDANGNQVTETRQVQKTAWSSASGTVQRLFDDVLIPATKSLPTKKLVALEPWDLPAVKPYDPAFLAGFRAHRYQVDAGQGFEEAKVAMEPQIRDDVCQDIAGDEQRISDISTAYTAVTFKHLLLPVWLVAYRFQQKVYHVMVNGRTAEVHGERPVSAAKIVMLVLAIMAAIGIFLLLKK